MRIDKEAKDAEVQGVITQRRKKLAKLIAAGYTQREAYESAYNTRGGSKNAHAKNGHKIAHLPEVRELIAQYEREIIPLGDLRREQEDILSHIKSLAWNALDEKTRLAASVKLYELLEVHRQTQEKIPRHAATTAVSVDAVVKELLEISASPAIELETIESGTLETNEETAEEKPGS
jgi:hypothetical protein